MPARVVLDDDLSAVGSVTIAGMRNHLVHGYFAVDVHALWVAVTVEVPDLARTVRSWLEDY